MNAHSAPPGSHRGRRALWFALGVLLSVVCTAAGAIWGALGSVPRYSARPVSMPSPNALDDFAAAAALLPKRRVTLGPADLPRLSTPELREYVRLCRSGLAATRSGFEHRYENPQVTSFRQLLPELTTVRELAVALQAQGLLAEREGRWTDAARCYLDTVRVGMEAAHGGCLLDAMVSVFVQHHGLQGLARVIDHLDARAARAAYAELERLDRHSVPVQETLALDREAMLAATSELFRAPHSWEMFTRFVDPVPPRDGLAGVAASMQFNLTPKRRVLTDFQRYSQRVIAWAVLPYCDPAAAPAVPGDPIDRAVAHGETDLVIRHAQRTARLRAVEAGLAARAYASGHRAPPASLDLLVPAYLPKVPADPFTRFPLRATRSSSSFVVYSLGPDRRDDGGVDAGPYTGRLVPGGDIAVRVTSSR